jgi:hypothetical protein
MKPRETSPEEIAEAIRSAAGARGHKLKPHFCDNPHCPGCRMLDAVNGAPVEFKKPARERSREPGEEG